MNPKEWEIQTIYNRRRLAQRIASVSYVGLPTGDTVNMRDWDNEQFYNTGGEEIGGPILMADVGLREYIS